MMFTTLLVTSSALTLLPLCYLESTLSLFSLFVTIIVGVLSMSSPDSFCATLFITVDSVSVLLLYVTVIVLFVSFLSHVSNSNAYLFFYLFMFVSSTVVFSTSHLLLLYMFFEFSLVGISYAVVRWGVYPDRGYSATILLLFTSLFSFPLSVYLLSIYSVTMTWDISLLTPYPLSLPFWVSLWILLSFMVKLPTYFLHSWLPYAHVEAPTFGSMILAGLLLKLGGCGILRLMPLLQPSIPSLSVYLTMPLATGVILASLLCCTQSDMKRLVAYSSVVHMTMLPLLSLSLSTLSTKTILMLMVFHGYTSPLMFLVVGVVSTTFSTRQLPLTRGLLLVSPVFSTLLLATFILSVPVPPIVSFMSEVFFFISLLSLTSMAYPLLVTLLLLVMVYSSLWLLPLVFSTPSTSTLLLPTPTHLLLLLALVIPMLGSSMVLWMF